MLINQSDWLENFKNRKIKNVTGSFLVDLRQMVRGSPELVMPMVLLLTWKITAIASTTRPLILAILLTGVLVLYSGRVLNRNPWLLRLGWVSPPGHRWIWSIVAGLAAASAIWAVARLFHQSLGPFPRLNQFLLASVAGPMAEELLFRGLLFWALVTLLIRMHVRQPLAQLISVLLVALAFAGAHIGRAGVSFVCTILTGASFGAMRVWSQSTVAAVLMHATYNFALCWLTLA
jgi:membrane protease YdiL (CAAX protease family)